MAEKSEKYHRRTNENIDTLPAANVKAKKSPAGLEPEQGGRLREYLSTKCTNIITQGE